MEKFLNSNSIKFSKVYVKISGSQHDARLLKAKARSISKARLFQQPFVNESSSETAALLSSTTTQVVHNNDDNLLFKLRTIYFKNGLPIYKQSVIDILKRAWLSKVNKKQFESQNGIRVIVSVYDISHYLTTKNENVYGYRYTVSINGQDPEFLAVTEPTYAEYAHETEMDAEKSIKFCPCNAFEIERLYISAKIDSVELLETKINKVLARVWNQLNDIEITGNRQLPNNRIVGKSKLEMGFVSLLKQNVNRLSISWLVDGSLPNPVYFKRPSLDDVLPYLSDLGINLYDGTPLINQSIQIEPPSKINNLDQLKLALQNAWRKANPNIRQDYFYVLIDNNNKVNKNKDISVSKRDTNKFNQEGSSNKLVYFIGIQDKSFDASEIQQPTLRVLQEEIKRLVPDVKFIQDKTIEIVETNNDNINKNNNNNNMNDANEQTSFNNVNNNFSTVNSATRKTKQIPVS
jgi:hypothetical protein